MKKRSLWFKYGSFSAALLALALGMASWRKKMEQTKVVP